ncbi:hypothetical protein [Luteipulveratus halotolerans]|uniref:Uncharacterized protein n=1 Tax=Luteipulveratus halotolerans TaxID=1631356 RepID=A0A0L6CK21_9MICO|nr:hypothetical protein [Luteipulveratus halotolerans]KNX37945.1 hypothetical protein VV01_13555 [Luteipulveratus halotolerans]
MQHLWRRPVAILYWVVAFVLSVLAGVGGAVLGRSWAPELGTVEEGAAATSGARFLFGVIGFCIGAAALAAVFAGVWMLAWARHRRTTEQVPEHDAEDDLADLLIDDDGAFIDDVSESDRRLAE